MMLLTQVLREKLLKNGANRDQDHAPVVKFFNPCGAATWLISEMDPEEPDLLFGLCDLGHGFPELGNVLLSEISGFKGRAGLGIERDRHFTGKHPMSVYAEAARDKRRIVETSSELEAAAAALKTRDKEEA